MRRQARWKSEDEAWGEGRQKMRERERGKRGTKMAGGIRATEMRTKQGSDILGKKGSKERHKHYEKEGRNEWMKRYWLPEVERDDWGESFCHFPGTTR